MRQPRIPSQLSGEAGLTLSELIIVVFILGLTAAFVGLVATDRPATVVQTPLDESRQRAVELGTVLSTVDSTGLPRLFLPDGRALGPDLDPVTGAAQPEEQP